MVVSQVKTKTVMLAAWNTTFLFCFCLGASILEYYRTLNYAELRWREKPQTYLPF